MIGETTARPRRDESVDVGAQLSLLILFDNALPVNCAFCSHEPPYVAGRAALGPAALTLPMTTVSLGPEKGSSGEHLLAGIRKSSAGGPPRCRT